MNCDQLHSEAGQAYNKIRDHLQAVQSRWQRACLTDCLLIIMGLIRLNTDYIWKLGRLLEHNEGQQVVTSMNHWLLNPDSSKVQLAGRMFPIMYKYFDIAHGRDIFVKKLLLL